MKKIIKSLNFIRHFLRPAKQTSFLCARLSKTLIVCLAIAGGFACTDFLDQTSPSELNSTTVYNSVDWTRLRINKLYGSMTLDQTYSQYLPIVWGLNSDCELVDGLGNDAFNTTSERGNMNFNSNPGWGNLAKVWDAMYGIVEDANLIIEGINGSDLIQEEGSLKTTMLYFRAEALTIRAMVYFDMLRYFGDIPLKLESTRPDLSNVFLGKTDRDEIMDTLIVNLKEAVASLPWAGDADYTTERVTKGYAHALLANIALTRAGWNIREKDKSASGYITAGFTDPIYPTQRCSDQKRKEMYELALEHLGIVILSNTHNLNPSIENQWYLINQRILDVSTRENIFEMPMGLNKSGELGYTAGVRINGASRRYGAKGNSSGKLKLTAPYFWSFDRKDLRRDLTCANFQIREVNGDLMEEMIGNAPFAIYCAKWDIRKMNNEWLNAALASSEKVPTGINSVKMRYPQVLLMFAEVMNELYGADVVDSKTGISAREALRQVHARAFADTDKTAADAYVAGLPADKEGFFDAIVQENAWELAGEGFRKFDLIRWNLLSDRIDRFKDDYKTQINEYPDKVYFKYIKEPYYEDAKGNQYFSFVIDMSSVHWYEVPANTNGYESKAFFGAERNDSSQKQLKENLPSISSGLNSAVINRSLLPIASTTISASNGMLSNSYGF